MAAYDNRYSRVIAWLKILLPLIALGLLSTMFMISRSIDPTRAIPFAQVDVEGIAREQRITGPSFSGVTEDGAKVSFAADSARPQAGDPNTFDADNLTATLTFPSGSSLDFSAPRALIDGTNSRIALSDGVLIETTTDYLIEAETLIATMDLGQFDAEGGVAATGPLGRLTASSAQLERGEEPGTFLLVFKDRVKLVYEPASEGSE